MTTDATVVTASSRTDTALLLTGILQMTEEYAAEDKQYLAYALDTAVRVHHGQILDEPPGPYSNLRLDRVLRNTLCLLRWGVTDMQILLCSVLHDTLDEALNESIRVWRSRQDGSRPRDAARRDRAGAAGTAGMIQDWLEFDFGSSIYELLEKASYSLENSRRGSQADRALKYARHAVKQVGQPGHDRRYLLLETPNLVDRVTCLFGRYGIIAHPGAAALGAAYLPAVEAFRSAAWDTPEIADLSHVWSQGPVILLPAGRMPRLRCALDEARDALKRLLG
ncbi:hypothetical protein [Arthrobacter mobilis]|uniref:Uncharacterized protein n=1 Tax=Arthrobacter mobilis TaxID=2724944 RepID=A0A7X6K749_9MICC|nr:hypothetical protein [Arthrobacter mobilis]NKX56380.1 hypothetical protein [Arthrobacter mobilis]